MSFGNRVMWSVWYARVPERSDQRTPSHGHDDKQDAVGVGRRVGGHRRRDAARGGEGVRPPTTIAGRNLAGRDGHRGVRRVPPYRRTPAVPGAPRRRPHEAGRPAGRRARRVRDSAEWRVPMSYRAPSLGSALRLLAAWPFCALSTSAIAMRRRPGQGRPAFPGTGVRPHRPADDQTAGGLMRWIPCGASGNGPPFPAAIGGRLAGLVGTVGDGA